MNLYSALGLTPDATHEQIRAAYKVLAQRLHPDKSGADETALEQFQRVREAHEVLSDPERRKLYDETGETKRKPDVYAQAQQQIAQAFVGLAEQNDWAVLPYADGVRKALSAHLEKLRGEAREAEAQIARFEAFVAPTTKGDDGNVFEGVIRQRIEGQQKRARALAAQIEQFEVAVEIMVAYEDQVAMQRQVQANPSGFWTVGATTTST